MYFFIGVNLGKSWILPKGIWCVFRLRFAQANSRRHLVARQGQQELLMNPGPDVLLARSHALQVGLMKMRLAIVVQDHLRAVDEVLQLDQMATFLETRLFRVLAGPGLILCNAVSPGFLQEEALELRRHVRRQELLSRFKPVTKTVMMMMIMIRMMIMKTIYLSSSLHSMSGPCRPPPLAPRIVISSCSSPICSSSMCASTSGSMKSRFRCAPASKIRRRPQWHHFRRPERAAKLIKGVAKRQ